MTYEQNYLAHFGIKGQRWGVRRFQNEDGTLTAEGRERYLGNDSDRSMGAITLATYNVLNKTVDKANRELSKINKEYDKKYGKDFDFGTDDAVNLEYTRRVRDSWQKAYRDVLAEDLDTDPASLKGQKWLDEMYGYKSNMDEEVKELEKKVSEKSKKDRSSSSSKSKSKASDIPYSDNGIDPSTEKYGRTKMSSEKAFEIAYEDLEKKYPNFSDMSQKKQDKLFIDYVNETGLYRWM